MYRRGYSAAGIPLTEESDLPMWSRVDLSAAKPIQLFSAGGGPNAITSLTTANKIDQNKDFDIRRIEFSIQRTDKTPLVTADLSLIGALLREYWCQLFTNETKRSWFAPMGGLVKYPMQVAAAGASAYDPVNVVSGGTFINVPEGLVIKGGEAFLMQLTSEVPATDLTGLTLYTVLWGRLFALDRAKIA